MKKYSKLTFLLPWFICSLGALFYAYEYLLRIAPSVMTDDLMRFYKIDDGTLGKMIAFYYFIYTPMQLVVGVLMDRYGPRRLLTFATLCCVIGSVLFAGTSSLSVAEFGRLLVGFGSAFAFVGVLKLATIWLPRRYFAMFSGMATALGMLGGIVGVISMTKLVEAFGWQNTIYYSAVFGVFLAIIIGMFVRDDNLERKRVTEHQPAVSLSSVLAGLLQIIRSSQMWIVGLIGCLLYLPISAFAELWGIPYLKQAHLLSPEQAAFAVSMIYWGWVFGGPFSGWLSDTIRQRRLPLTIMPLLATLSMVSLLFINKLSLFDIYALLFVFGICTSVQVIVFAIGREISPSHMAATAMAFINMVVMLSGVIFQPLIGKILDLLWHGAVNNGVQVFTVQDYQNALIAIPVMLMLGMLVARFAMKETHCRSLEPVITSTPVVDLEDKDFVFKNKVSTTPV